MNKEESIIKLEESLLRLENKENTIYFLTYDSKTTPRASVKHIYDIALTLKKDGQNVKMLVEDKNYQGVSSWLGDRYQDLEILSIKEDKVELKIDDILVVPEYYSNVLEQLSNVKCMKVMLIQQKDYIFENLPIGSRWSDYGFDRAIVTTEATKKYVNSIFPETIVHIIPPMIEDVFKPYDKLKKPYVAISCRDRNIHRRLISEFYLKYPQLRWITFRDMVQMTYEEFASNLSECMVSVWVDGESTFGTFPLESIKCGVPVIGKIPDTEPDWLSENGMWTYDINKVVDILGTFILAWIEGVELNEDVKQKMKETLLPYDSEITVNNVLTVFESFKTRRKETIKSGLEKLKQTETV